MSTGLDVFSAISTVITTLDTIISIMTRLYDARQNQQKVPSVLKSHKQELHNIRQILEVVSQEKGLQVVQIIDDVKQLSTHIMTLEKFLEYYGKERGQVKQYTNQLFNGTRNLDDLASIMASMSHAKANLSIKIQVLHVGLTRDIGDIVVVNFEAVEALDRNLRTFFGGAMGLKLAEPLRQKPRRGDGTVLLKDANIASLGGSEDSCSLDEERVLAGTTSRKVDRNETRGDSLQLNGPIGIEGFKEVDHLVIVNNTAVDKSIQVNHAVSQDNFDKILFARFSLR